MLDNIRQDLRYALRGLRRSPGFTATVILTLGLGIGANAAMFGVIDRLMFRPYPFMRDPGEVSRVYLQRHDRERLLTSSSFEYTRFLDLKQWGTTWNQIAAYSDGVTAIGTGESSREYRVARVSGTFFDFFDARPVLGRFFTPAEDTTPRGAAVAVLSHAFWKHEYGRRNVLGEQIQIGNIGATIIGVAPEGFVGVSDGEAPAAFIPITTYAGSNQNQQDATTYYTRYNWGWLSVMLRRKPGVSEEEAGADFSNAYLRSWNMERDLEPRMTPAEIARPRAVISSLRFAAGPNRGMEAKTLLWVSGVAVIVLLIACANVANLMFARVLRRRREIALRLALGVSRGRLIAQSLTESMVLALMGCAAGMLIAQWGGAAFRRLFVEQGAAGGLLTDGRTLGLATIASVLAGLFVGLLPGVMAMRTSLVHDLKSGAREGVHQRSRTRTILLVAQGAMSVILLVGAGLFVRSLGNVRQMRLGYDAEPVLTLWRNYRGLQLDSAVRGQLGRDILEAAKSLPGVEHAALATSVPFWSTSSTSLFVSGIDSVRRLGSFTYQSASTDYFATMGTRIVRGRGFTDADRAGAPRVAVVSEAMARVLWPGQEALGQCMRVSNDTMPCTTVVGIAEDAVQRSLLDDDTRFRYYLPIEQVNSAGWGIVLLRMRGDAKADAERVRRALQAHLPGSAYFSVTPLIEIVDSQRRSWMIGATMFVAFGVLALIVAAVGLYGVISYGVAQRMHEMGVRIALGARSGDVVRLVVGQGLRVSLAGVVIGIAVAYLVGPKVQPLLFQQPARDPWTYGFVGATLLAVALLASALPARRATRADPNAALRSD